MYYIVQLASYVPMHNMHHMQLNTELENEERKPKRIAKRLQE